MLELLVISMTHAVFHEEISLVHATVLIVLLRSFHLYLLTSGSLGNHAE